jgi:hypothetical protein
MEQMIMFRYVLIIQVLLFLVPIPASALPTITCHCFRDRTYDAANPSSADPYFLATTQNSFFSLVFKVDKTAVVMKKQQGISADDLWIAYWVASRTGASATNLLEARHNKNSWQDVLAPMRFSGKVLGTRFSRALTSLEPEMNLAETAVDELFRSYRLLSEAELAAMRRGGASNQELILADVIAVRMHQPAHQIYHEEKNGSKTWGFLLMSAGIDTKKIQEEIANILHL